MYTLEPRHQGVDEDVPCKSCRYQTTLLTCPLFFCFLAVFLGLYGATSPSSSNGNSAAAAASASTSVESVLQMREAETIYDYAWYPLMSSSDPATCCFISSSRDHPMHMWQVHA